MFDRIYESLDRIKTIFNASSDDVSMLATMTHKHLLTHLGRVLHYSELDTDVDTAAPKQISITTQGLSGHIAFGVYASAAVAITINRDVVLGTGGSVAAGTAVVGYNKNQGFDDDILLLAVKKDYVLGATGESAGTAIDYAYVPGATQGQQRIGGGLAYDADWFELKKNSMYGIILTPDADTTTIAWGIDLYEE
ncbi:MAG: hypothetical protein IMZ61_04725 [Planctomycetes bacterium]|nr:hypothetical protein [Planctomycetota bacterium]